MRGVVLRSYGAPIDEAQLSTALTLLDMLMLGLLDTSRATAEPRTIEESKNFNMLSCFALLANLGLVWLFLALDPNE